MATYEGSRFLGKAIGLDGNAFRRCSFERCSLKFGATAATELSGCSFIQCRLIAEGPAGLTIAYLKGFHQGLGEWGHAAVEGLFDYIRGQEDAPRRGAQQALENRVPSAWQAELEAFGASAEGRTIVSGFKRLSKAQRGQIAALIGRAAQADPAPGPRAMAMARQR